MEERSFKTQDYKNLSLASIDHPREILTLIEMRPDIEIYLSHMDWLKFFFSHFSELIASKWAELSDRKTSNQSPEVNIKHSTEFIRSVNMYNPFFSPWK